MKLAPCSISGEIAGDFEPPILLFWRWGGCPTCGTHIRGRVWEVVAKVESWRARATGGTERLRSSVRGGRGVARATPQRADLWLIVCAVLVGIAGRAFSAASPSDARSVVVLTNTAVATGAAGSVRWSGGGTNSGAGLTLETRGLDAGTYEISAVCGPGRPVMSLSSFTIYDPTLASDAEAGQSKKEDNTTHQSTDLTSRTAVQLPGGLDLTNISAVVVSRSGGQVVLGGKMPR